LRLELISHTTDADVVIATAVLTTTSKLKPSTLFYRLKKDRKRVIDILSRIEVQHGSILDHNRLCWILEANDSEVLEIFLKHRFFSFTKLDKSKWLLSANFRTTIRYIDKNKEDLFGKALIDTIPNNLSMILFKIRGRIF
jgi:hypothetical protein